MALVRSYLCPYLSPNTFFFCSELPLFYGFSTLIAGLNLWNGTYNNELENGEMLDEKETL
jgi:hypothetical protein